MYILYSILIIPAVRSMLSAYVPVSMYLQIGYATTESGPISITRFEDSKEEQLNTTGRVAPYTEVKIVDTASGQNLPRGNIGEIWTRGCGLMRGYWNDPQ